MHTHQEKNIPHIVIMACIYIMPFIPKYFSNCSIANLIRSPICRVYLHYSALLASITFWTWSFKMCHRVFMLRFFVSGDHFFYAQWSCECTPLFNFYCDLQNPQQKLKTTQYGTRHQKNIWFYSQLKLLAKSPMISLAPITAWTLEVLRDWPIFITNFH